MEGVPSHCFSLVHQSGSEMGCGRYVKGQCADLYMSTGVSESPNRKATWDAQQEEALLEHIQNE